MRFLFLFLVIALASVSCTYIQDTTQFYTKNGDFYTRQKNLLRLLNHINMPNANKDQVEIGKNWRFEGNFDKFTNVQGVKEFYRFYLHGMLPKYKIFSINYDQMRKEAISLFQVFYTAKDFDTFYRVACWARDQVNEGMFVYSLTVACFHRPDCKGFVLPPPYEIYPNFFLNSEVIHKGYRMKMQGKVYDQKLADFYGIHMNGNVVTIDSKYSGWYRHVNQEQKLTYFTEDIGLNTYYFYYHMINPFWMGGQQYTLNKYKRGENFYYFHQQLLARFYMERLSNGLGEIPIFSWYTPIKTGFMSSLTYQNGLHFPSRQNFYDMKTDVNFWTLNDIEDSERKIRDAIQQGFFKTEDGTLVDMKNPEAINVLGNIIQGNKDSPNTRFYKYMGLISKTILGATNKPFYNYYTIPSVLEHYETCLRDPMFYQLYKRYIYYFMQYKSFLQPYTREQLLYPGIKVDDVHVDKLVTFFDTYDVDMTNAMYLNPDEFMHGKEDLVFYARQYRLNHKPFDVKVDIDSDKATDVLIRFFLAPKYDSMNREIQLNQNRYNFFEMDRYVRKLEKGKNTIVRNSRDFFFTVKDRVQTRDFLKLLDTKDTTQFMGEHFMNEEFYGLPDRLLLPKGKEGGMFFKFFVVITPYTTVQTTGDNFSTHFMNKFMTTEALGYPFDRRIDETQFYVPNLFFKDVTIFHKNLRDTNRSFMTYDDVQTDYGFYNTHDYVDTTKNFMDTGFMGTQFMDTHFMNKDTITKQDIVY